MQPRASVAALHERVRQLGTATRTRMRNGSPPTAAGSRDHWTTRMRQARVLLGRSGAARQTTSPPTRSPATSLATHVSSKAG